MAGERSRKEKAQVKRGRKKKAKAVSVKVRRKDVRGADVRGLLRKVRWAVPANKEDLRNYVKAFVGVDVPDVRVCEGHCSVMDYLWHSFSESRNKRTGNADCVVWACRGGGKTAIAALASLLDCVFKAGCKVQILGGSAQQSARMYEYFVKYLDGGFAKELEPVVRKDKCLFSNGSQVEVLTQSQRSVRGSHVHKLRCDELDEFDGRVFEAAKFITHSRGGITAAMELISTMHRPYGLMSTAISDDQRDGAAIFKWCMFEVMEKCEGRSCSRCALWSDCGGRAKRSNGFLKIDDCISRLKRSSRAGFEAEMLCRKPVLDNAVFAEFDVERHVAEVDYDANLPLYRAIDFGFVNPFVCLWIQVDEEGVVRVIDEYVRRRATVEEHGRRIKELTPCAEERVAGTFCDPAGAAAGQITGSSAVSELRRLGIRVRYRRSTIQEGIELIRRAIRDGEGRSRLVVSGRCVRLIEALQSYHYPEAGSGEEPVKDGVYDHPIDALRYFFVGIEGGRKVVLKRY